MIVLGLTGPSGAGKGEVARRLQSLGAHVIDADAVYHALLVPPSPCLDALCARFGKEILTDAGELDRKKLGSIVFSDKSALNDLNAIAHRYVMERVRKELSALQKSGRALAVLDAPQLVEAGAERDCDAVIAVLAAKETRLLRITARDGIDRDAALRRINAQHTDAFFRERSDYIIENNGDADELLPAIERILAKIGGATS
jgi:dephospho-CoA kinase